MDRYRDVLKCKEILMNGIKEKKDKYLSEWLTEWMNDLIDEV